jgi:transcriptional regulator with XRE-family HTH domain
MTGFEEVFGTQSDAEQEELTLEGLTLSIQVALQDSMMRNCISRKELAERLGVSPARVSQILSCHGSNLTLRTVARVAHALGEDFELISKDELRRMKKQARRRELSSIGQRLAKRAAPVGWHDVTANENRYPDLMAA